MSSAGPAGSAARRWADGLAAWAIPARILDAAPEPPWGFPPGIFARAARDALTTDTPSRRRAVEALVDGATVLDVGAGGGAASIRLAPPAGHVTAVDASADMLSSFGALADEHGVAHAEVPGPWPEMAAAVGPADVCVCHHVVYNVADLGPFAAALTDHARRRVVLELTASHPQSTLDDLWWHFHRVERPTGPTAPDAIAVLEAVGMDVHVERWSTPSFNLGAGRDARVAFARRRLCLPPERDPEIDELIDDSALTAPRDLVTLWWDGTG